MLKFLILGAAGSIVLVLVGILNWSFIYHLKNPGISPDFFAESGAYFAWLKLFFLSIKSAVAGVDWQSHAPSVDWHGFGKYIAVVALVVLVVLASKPVFHFIEKVILMNGYHEAIALEFAELARSKASSGDEERRNLSLEELDRFAQAAATANSGIKALFINGQLVHHELLAREMHERFVAERESKKKKTPNLVWTAKVWYLTLNGRLKQARNVYHAKESNVSSANLIALLEDENSRLPFWLQTKFVRRLWKHPQHVQVTVVENGVSRTATGMDALYYMQLYAPGLGKPSSISMTASL